MCNTKTMNIEELINFIKELRAIKNNSDELDHESCLQNQEFKWRNRLEYNFLESCIKHSHDEIRMQVLGLLVESKKSTLFFTHKEFELILKFVIFNLGEPLEFVPLIKKVFKRIKESLAVFKRNIMQFEKLKLSEELSKQNKELKEEYRIEANSSSHSINYYHLFFLNIRDICIDGISPGSTHIRKKNSLQILYLQEEFLADEFPNSLWSEEQVHELFQCLLLDTYDINKEMAYKILSKLDPSLLKLDSEERVYELIHVALQLANSIRPIDSITASYMLKLSISSPIIRNILNKFTKIEIPFLPNSNPHDHHDIVLRLIIIIIEKLKGPCELASKNIIRATAKHALYGYLFCIKSLLSSSYCNIQEKGNDSNWIKIINDIISICLYLNQSVSKIVNNSSPEGHFPMDLHIKNLDSQISSASPQRVLLCSWRTIKETSSLFGYLTEKSPIQGEKKNILGLLSENQLIEMSHNLVKLLCETKHRGAFEQAYVGFLPLCKRLWQLENNGLYELPKIWLHQLLLTITGLSQQGHDNNSKLCSTRRSAGVPFMVQALIASEPSVLKKSTVFHPVMRILLGLTEIKMENELSSSAKRLIESEIIFSNMNQNIRNESEKHHYDEHNSITLTEVKTHALNILRTLFKNAQLGDLTKNYTTHGLIVAIKCHDEKTWAERNAATLLYSSLITRIFGVQRTKDHVNLTVHNKMTGWTFFEKYPKLLEFISCELKNFIKSPDSLIKPSVQLILLLLSRLYVSNSNNIINHDDHVNWKIDEFHFLVSSCAKSRVYYTRELAARALVPLLNGKTVVPFLNNLFEFLKNKKNYSSLNMNLIHGYMIQILGIIKSSLFRKTTKSIEHEQVSNINFENFIFGSMECIMNNLQIHNNGPAIFPIATEFLNILNELVNRKILTDNVLLMIDKKLKEQSSLHINELRDNSNIILKDYPGLQVYQVSAANLQINLLAWKLEKHQEIEDTELLNIWESILSHPNYDVQITGWSCAMNLIEQTCNLKFYEYTLDLALKNIITYKKIHPENLKRTCIIHDFLSHVFIKNENFIKPYCYSNDNLVSLASSILKSLEIEMSQLHEEQSVNASFLKLLGKSYGRLIKFKNKNKSFQKISMNFERMIYEIFRENSWTNSARGEHDCGIAIATVIYDIYPNVHHELHNKKKEIILNYEILLNWWTTVLQLLVHDNKQVRTLACTVLPKIIPGSQQVHCDFYSLNIFFEIFPKDFHDQSNVIFAALFVWSLTLLDHDEEMDECHVFNKCHNYETLEPLRISRLCHEQLKILLNNNHNIHAVFPSDVQTWLSQRLNIDLSACFDARSLIKFYETQLPKLNNKLHDILDPTYHDKLLQNMAFQKFKIFETNFSC